MFKLEIIMLGMKKPKKKKVRKPPVKY